MARVSAGDEEQSHGVRERVAGPGRGEGGGSAIAFSVTMAVPVTGVFGESFFVKPIHRARAREAALSRKRCVIDRDNARGRALSGDIRESLKMDGTKRANTSNVLSCD